jgi:hypothetical protein
MCGRDFRTLLGPSSALMVVKLPSARRFQGADRASAGRSGQGEPGSGGCWSRKQQKRSARTLSVCLSVCLSLSFSLSARNDSRALWRLKADGRGKARLVPTCQCWALSERTGTNSI